MDRFKDAAASAQLRGILYGIGAIVSVCGTVALCCSGAGVVAGGVGVVAALRCGVKGVGTVQERRTFLRLERQMDDLQLRVKVYQTAGTKLDRDLNRFVSDVAYSGSIKLARRAEQLRETYEKFYYSLCDLG